MKITQRLRLLFSATLHDLFGEDDTANHRTVHAEAPWLEPAGDALLQEAQVQLARLKTAQSAAAVSRKRIEIELRQAVSLADRLDSEADAALATGQEELARRKLAELQRLKAQVQILEEQQRTNREMAGQLEDELRRLGEQLDNAHRKQAELDERRRSLQAQEEFAQAQRDLRRSVSHLRDQQQQQEYRVAREEDRLAARREINRKKENGPE